MPTCLATRSSGGRGPLHPPNSESCLTVAPAPPRFGTARAFAREHGSPFFSHAPLVVSSEFYAVNGGHVILDDIGLAYAAARAWGFDDFVYVSHHRKSGELEPFRGPRAVWNDSYSSTLARAAARLVSTRLIGVSGGRLASAASSLSTGDARQLLRARMVERQRELFAVLFPQGVPSTSARGACGSALIAGLPLNLFESVMYMLPLTIVGRHSLLGVERCTQVRVVARSTHRNCIALQYSSHKWSHVTKLGHLFRCLLDS